MHIDRLIMSVLRSFCADDPNREAVSKPFCDGRFAYATDGRSAIRIDFNGSVFLYNPRVDFADWKDVPKLLPELFAGGKVIAPNMDFIVDCDRACINSLAESRLVFGEAKIETDECGPYLVDEALDNAAISIRSAGIYAAGRVMRAIGAVRVLGGVHWTATVSKMPAGALRISGRGGDIDADVVVMCKRAECMESNVVVDAETGEIVNCPEVNHE